MKLIHVAAAVLNQTPLDWDGNRRRIVDAIRAARDQGASILCLPEMCICGYGCEDMFLAPGVAAKSLEVLGDLLPETRGLIVSLGLPLRFRKSLFNTACLAVDGAIAGFVAKRFLAGDGIHYEPRWFKPWPEGVAASVDVPGAGREIPLGDIYFDCGGVKIGFEICEDAWAAERPGGDLSARGVDVLLNPSASHFAFGKIEVRKRLLLEGSRAFGVAYVYANLLGNEAGRAIYDGGALIASQGKLVAAGPRFSYQDAIVTSGIVDIDASRFGLAQSASFQSDLTAPASGCVSVRFEFPQVAPRRQAVAVAPWEQSACLKEEEFARALPLALFDYLRKSRSRGFVVSLSGGADSATVACMAALMVNLGVADLGIDGFCGKLGLATPRGAGPDAERELTRELLCCVYQATENSSDTTRDAARAVAHSIGAEYHELQIDSLVRGYVDLIEKAIGRRLAWETDDVALQNVQARVRAPSVWLLANLKNALLLATSNRSEAAVGYATMDGDTCGGLSPIAGVDKAYLRRWLRWLETTAPHGVHPFPALEAVNAQQPTAELRPSRCRQTDEVDLMPYDLLDVIERAAIRDKRSPVEVFQQVRADFPDHEPPRLAFWVERFFRLWARNQWKRERYAPSFHLDDENLDPKTWCRFPILSGGFEAEIADLRRFAATQER